MEMISSEKLISFENRVKELWENGELPYLIHLCGGNEDQLINIFKRINPEDYVLSTHRSHYHYLLKGGSEDKLMEMIKMGDSMFVFDKKLNFFTSSIVAGTPSIAAGIALSGKKVWCFVGDGATDNGHFYEAVRFVDYHSLPCTFIIEDNDRSVNTPKYERMGLIHNLPKCVIYYSYKSTYPHAGSGCKHKIIFK